MKKLVKSFFGFLYHFYGVFLRAQFGYACKFQPTCSCYARDAFNTHTFLRATYITFTRILRCHPFGSGGFDPVPQSKESSDG